MSEWFLEKNFDNGWTQTFSGNKIYDKQSPYQNIKIIETKLFGRVLLLDDVIQCTEVDESYYHEMMAHVCLFAHDSPKNILVIGGGDGGIIKEVLRHNDVERITLVEIDEKVIEVSKELLPSISDGSFNNPKLNLVIGDGIDWVKTCSEKYDIIIVDRSDHIGPSMGLYEIDFYRNCKAILNEKGIFVAQSGNWPINKHMLVDQLFKMPSAFKKSSCYISTISSFVGGFTCFIWAADWNINLPVEIISEKIQNKNIKNLKYYNKNTHIAAFALPNCIQDLL